MFGKIKAVTHGAKAPSFQGLAKKAPRTPAPPAFPKPTQALRSLSKTTQCATCPGAKRSK